jgi:hypothetical protein
VADRIAEYCEAYIKIANICQAGTKCCVSRDIYGDKKPPPELFVPTPLMENRTTPRTIVESTTPQVVGRPCGVIIVLLMISHQSFFYRLQNRVGTQK